MGAVLGAGDRWQAVALSVLLVTSLVAAGVTGSAAAASDPAATETGVDNNSPLVQSDNEMQSDADTGEASAATAEVTHTYMLRPDEPGIVRLQMNYSIPDTVDTFGEFARPQDTVVSKRGFVRDGDKLLWDGETADPSIVLDIAVNESDRFQYGAVDVGEWAFFNLYPTNYGDANLTITATEPAKIAAGDQWAYLGPFTRHSYSGTHEDFQLIEPAAADLAVEPSKTFAHLNEAAERLRFGDDGPDSGVTIFALPDPMDDSGGEAFKDDIWVHESARIDIPADDVQTESVYLHEYVHTRQDTLDVSYSGEDVTMWLIEGTASMYATLLGWQLDNGVSFRNLRNFGQSEVVLANRSTYDGARPGYRRGAGVLTALDYRIRAATDGEQSFQDVLTTMSDRDDEINATELQSIAESVADREFETFFDRYVYGDEPYPLPPKPAHYPAIETEPITATVTGPEVTPSDCIVVLDRSISIGNQDTQGLPSDLTTLRGPYASVPVGTSPAVSVPAEPFSRAGVSEPYDLYYLQDSEERAFPRDGVADAVSLGSVDTLPGSVETTLADVPTRTLTARAVNESGEPIPNAGIAVHVEDQVAIRSQTTAEGAFLNRSGTRGVELGDGVKISARSPATQSLPRFALPDGRALDTRIILQETVPDLAVVGTAVPRSLSVDEAATLSLLVANLGDAEDRTETVYVDGDPVTEVSLEDREAFSWTTPVTLTFETPGTHTIRVGENPPRSVDVDLASLAADFEVSPGSPEAGGIVTFENATASTAPVESLEWDLDDDGTVEKTGETVTYSYDDAGTYNVTLTVTNADGESDAVTRTVTVTERTGPPALPGETALPQDPDDDGVYEDVTGDGALTIADVRLYFESIYQNRDSAYVENNRGFFHLTSDGAISLGDMQALFEAVSRGISPSGTTNLESLSSRTGVSGS